MAFEARGEGGAQGGKESPPRSGLYDSQSSDEERTFERVEKRKRLRKSEVGGGRGDGGGWKTMGGKMTDEVSAVRNPFSCKSTSGANM